MVVMLLLVIAQRVAGCAPAEGEEGAGQPCAARLVMQLQDGSQSRNCLESRVSSGDGRSLVENHHSMSPVQSPRHPIVTRPWRGQSEVPFQALCLAD